MTCEDRRRPSWPPKKIEVRKIAKDLWNKYEDKYALKVREYKRVIELLEDEIQNIEIVYDNPEQKNLGVFWKYRHEVLSYLQFCNGSLGNDMFIARYSLGAFLGYTLLIQNTELTEEEQNTCSIEIESQFYLLMNCIYNMKEKLERLFCIIVDKKNIDFKSTILTDSAKREILDLFKNAYPLINKFCKARGHIVHDIYVIRHIKEESSIYVSYSTFDLSEDKMSKNKSSKIMFSINELIQVIEVMQKLRKEVVMVLENFKSIDLAKIRDKFFNEKENAYVIKF